MTHQKIAWETHSANCHIEINPYTFLKHECHVFRCHCVLLLIIEISFSISLVTTHHKIISFWPFAIFSPFIKLFKIHFPYFFQTTYCTLYQVWLGIWKKMISINSFLWSETNSKVSIFLEPDRYHFESEIEFNPDNRRASYTWRSSLYHQSVSQHLVQFSPHISRENPSMSRRRQSREKNAVYRRKPTRLYFCNTLKFHQSIAIYWWCLQLF